MADFDPVTKKFLCNCGCGMEAESKYRGNYWREFYTNRIKEIYLEREKLNGMAGKKS